MHPIMSFLLACALLLAATPRAAVAAPPAQPQRGVGAKAGCFYPNQPCTSTTQARKRAFDIAALRNAILVDCIVAR